MHQCSAAFWSSTDQSSTVDYLPSIVPRISVVFFFISLSDLEWILLSVGLTLMKGKKSHEIIGLVSEEAV